MIMNSNDTKPQICFTNKEVSKTGLGWTLKLPTIYEGNSGIC